MRTYIIAFGTLAVACTTPLTVLAQRVAPVAATRAWEPPATPAVQAIPVSGPRPRLVAPVAFAFGVAGGVAGYYAAEESCAAGKGGECYDGLLYVPLGYALGVSLGGGIAGTTEGCRTAAPRALGGAVLGLVAGAVVAVGVPGLGLVALPVGPLAGATWLVSRCRTAERAAGEGGGG